MKNLVQNIYVFNQIYLCLSTRSALWFRYERWSLLFVITARVLLLVSLLWEVRGYAADKEHHGQPKVHIEGGEPERADQIRLKINHIQ